MNISRLIPYPRKIVLAALSLALFSGPAEAVPVVADLSKYVISIDSGFTGTDVLNRRLLRNFMAPMLSLYRPSRLRLRTSAWRNGSTSSSGRATTGVSRITSSPI